MFKEVKTILISQPEPTRSPYFDLEKKYGIKIHWRKFIQVEPVSAKEFRKTRIRPEEFTAILFNSKNAIDHFFRICDELRIRMSQDTKYFCLSETIANYLQKFIVYRKRKVFFGARVIQDMETALEKHKKNEKFLMPCSNLGSVKNSNYLDKNGFNWTSAMMFRTVSSDLSDLDNVKFDALVFFSPLGIKSLLENFPDFKQNETRLAIWGQSTLKEVKLHNLTPDIFAPTKEVPSLKLALENYIKKANKI